MVKQTTFRSSALAWFACGLTVLGAVLLAFVVYVYRTAERSPAPTVQTHLYPIVGVSARGTFAMVMADHDSIGSVYACMDRVHQLGGGRCEIAPGSLRAGRTNRLVRKYDDVYIALEFKP